MAELLDPLTSYHGTQVSNKPRVVILLGSWHEASARIQLVMHTCKPSGNSYKVCSTRIRQRLGDTAVRPQQIMHDHAGCRCVLQYSSTL